MELPNNLIKGLTGPDIFGNKVYNVFVKALSVFKEDRQAFGVILGTNTELSLKYAFTIVPLNIANLDHTLRRESKSNVGNFIVNESESIEVLPPRDSRRILKAKET